MNKEQVIIAIKEYFQLGGLFNPDLADHRQVSHLLLAALQALEDAKYHNE